MRTKAAERSTEAVETPAQDQLEKQAQCVHGDSAGNTVMTAKVAGVQGARFFIEAELQILGHAAGAASVIERHHEDAHEEHGGNGRRSNRSARS